MEQSLPFKMVFLWASAMHKKEIKGMEELKQKIINLCNESGLPLEAILFVTKDVWRDVESTLRDFKKKQEEQDAKAPKEDC